MCCNDSVINIYHLTCEDSFYARKYTNFNARNTAKFNARNTAKFARFTSQEM